MLTTNWVTRNAVMLRGQTQGRSRIPPVYSNGAVEQSLRELKAIIQPRRFAFRNRARMNTLLTLMRQAMLRVDNVADYSADIRAYLEAHNGHPQRTYRDVYDTRVSEGGDVLFNSLWSVPAQTIMRDARLKRSIGELARS